MSLATSRIPAGESALDLGVGNFLRSPDNANEAWTAVAPLFDGRFRVPTLRNVDKRPRPDFVKAYGHNGISRVSRRSFTSTTQETCCRNARPAIQARRFRAGRHPRILRT